MYSLFAIYDVQFVNSYLQGLCCGNVVNNGVDVGPFWIGCVVDKCFVYRCFVEQGLID